MSLSQARAIAAIVVVLCCGCSKKANYGVETYPVVGVVYVDGNPAAKLTVRLHASAGMDSAAPSVSATTTKDDGSFAVSTFEEGDGVPAGEYVATFTWGEYNMVTRSMGPDKLKGKYSDPKASDFKVTVSEGSPTDLGRIDLTAK